jgi:hypothetical protein
MNPKHIAGISGACGLAVIGLVGVKMAGNSRQKRDLLIQANEDIKSNDYEVEVDEEFATQEFVDPWISDDENSTALWKEFQAQLGIELEDEDVQMKQRNKNKQRGVNLNKLNERTIPKMHDAMVKEWEKRVENLNFYNEISGIDYGRMDPAEAENSADYSGYRKTAPVIQDFVNSFGCQGNGKSNWRKGAQTNVWFMWPETVPLWTDADNHVNDWKIYWKFVKGVASSWSTRANIRFSVGSYGATVRFTPRGYKFRPNTPWNRMDRYYAKPKMSAARPSVMNAVRTALTYVPRYGVSTPAAGDNCVMYFFFHDVPRDINDFMVPEQFEMINELHSICTVVPIVIAPNAKDDSWKKLMANFMPGMRNKFAKDPDYSGAFFLESFAELFDTDFVSALNNYLCLVENRAMCRTVSDAYVPPPSGFPTQPDPTEGFRGLEEDYQAPTEASEVTEAELTTAAPTTEGEATTAGAVTTPKVPEIDSCCGHDGYSSTPFDSELRTCCEDGQVRAYEFEGEDPCAAAADDFYFGNDYGFKK